MVTPQRVVQVASVLPLGGEGRRLSAHNGTAGTPQPLHLGLVGEPAFQGVPLTPSARISHEDWPDGVACCSWFIFCVCGVV